MEEMPSLHRSGRRCLQVPDRSSLIYLNGPPVLKETGNEPDCQIGRFRTPARLIAEIRKGILRSFTPRDRSIRVGLPTPEGDDFGCIEPSIVGDCPDCRPVYSTSRPDTLKMSNVNLLEAQSRTSIGTRGSRGLRREGIVPCNLYGHKQDSQAIQVCSVAVRTVINSGNRLCELVVDGKKENALLSDVVWDTFGRHVLHVDFQRVDVNEKVHVTVPILLRGTAPGVVGGGVLEQPHHEVKIECLAINIPHELTIRIGELLLGQYIHVSDLTDIPNGVTILDPPETVLVHVASPRVVVEPVAVEAPEAPEAAAKKTDGDSK